MLQKNKDGSVRKHFYLAENRREDGKIKIKLLRRISEEEALAFRRDRSRDRDTNTRTPEISIPTPEGRDSTIQELKALIDLAKSQSWELKNKAGVLRNTFKLKAFMELYLEPLLDA